MIVQIYEIQNPDEAARMIPLGVDHLGSVILSPDDIDNSQLKETITTIQNAGCKSTLIPLFHDVDTILTALSNYRPDIVHLCGTFPTDASMDQAVEDCIHCQEIIKDSFSSMAIMRSIPIGPPGKADQIPSLQWASALESFSDWFLTDTLIVPEGTATENEQPVAGFVGITGEICDWNVARALVEQSSIPVILAGGLGPHNVKEGIQAVKPAGVDSCTRTNMTDSTGRNIRFVKDTEKVKALVTSARRASASDENVVGKKRRQKASGSEK